MTVVVNMPKNLTFDLIHVSPLPTQNHDCRQENEQGFFRMLLSSPKTYHYFSVLSGIGFVICRADGGEPQRTDAAVLPEAWI